jgi:hypothetical protein
VLDRHDHDIRQQARGEGHGLPLVRGGVHRVARLLKHVRREQSPGFIRPDQEHAMEIRGGRATITQTAARARQAIVLTTVHDSSDTTPARIDRVPRHGHDAKGIHTQRG